MSRLPVQKAISCRLTFSAQHSPPYVSSVRNCVRITAQVRTTLEAFFIFDFGAFRVEGDGNGGRVEGTRYCSVFELVLKDRWCLSSNRIDSWNCTRYIKLNY